MSIPKFKIPDDGAPSDTVYYMIKDELDLDGRPNLNLARQVLHMSTTSVSLILSTAL